MNLENVLERLSRGSAGEAELEFLLRLEDEADLQSLYSAAYALKLESIGPRVHLRGIIEVSNICRKNCFYCGIRRDNTWSKRFRMSMDEVLSEARWSLEHHYGSVVIQAGELQTREFTDFIAEAVEKIKELSGGSLGITLSLGEQDFETYRRWFEAGAHRYLLRIESSNPELYRKLHPPDHDFATRLECLSRLRRAGFQVGTGVLIGFPGQSHEDLARDLLFFKQIDVDMIGMGPYLPHHDTPLSAEMRDYSAERQLKLGLKMIACARLLLRDVNIASTTALQALHPRGREFGLLAGANIIMPNVTDPGLRPAYQLYDNKPAINENSEESRLGLERSIANIGETIAYDEWGDSRHFAVRTKTTI